METMGYCPVCDYKKIAPTCQVCPQCGNRSWRRQTGNKGMGLVKTWCRKDHEYEDRHKCSVCNENGTIVEKWPWLEIVDTRTGIKEIMINMDGPYRWSELIEKLPD